MSVALANAAELQSIDRTSLTGREQTFQENQIIVSKTDARGVLTYVNRVFIDISGYEEEELLGRPHSMIRHPHMPRCIFKLLWETIKKRQEIFAYVVNRCKNGDHYWVLAHVTPMLGANGEIVGYHSNRRVPRREPLAVIEPIYKDLLKIESAGGTAAMEKAYETLMEKLQKQGLQYDQFIHSF